VSLLKKALVGDDLLGADDMAIAVMNLDGADELIGLHAKASLKGAGEQAEQL
jgi:hypothetical protein